MQLTEREMDRLATKFLVGDECWEWTGTIGSKGYGKFFRTDRTQPLAHRLVYELLVGPIPDGLQLDHLCRVRNCVKPSHLEPVTPGENIRRGETGKARGEQQRAKTHCPQGHPYAGSNLILTTERGRRCRTCKNAQRATTST